MNFDASIRYSVHGLVLELNPSSLTLLLYLFEILTFRNRIVAINLCNVTKPKMAGEEGWFVSHEDEYSFVRPGEAAYMLAQYFRQLRDADSFIELTLSYRKLIIGGQTTILRALQLSEFPEKIGFAHLWLGNSRKPGWRLFAESLSEFQPCIKIAAFITPKSWGKEVTKTARSELTLKICA